MPSLAGTYTLPRGSSHLRRHVPICIDTHIDFRDRTTIARAIESRRFAALNEKLAKIGIAAAAAGVGHEVQTHTRARAYITRNRCIPEYAYACA